MCIELKKKEKKEFKIATIFEKSLDESEIKKVRNHLLNKTKNSRKISIESKKNIIEKYHLQSDITQIFKDKNRIVSYLTFIFSKSIELSIIIREK